MVLGFCGRKVRSNEKGCNFMLLEEKKLRKIIRRQIIKENIASDAAHWLADYGKGVYKDGKKLVIMANDGELVPPKGILSSAVTDVNSILIDINNIPHAYLVLGKGKVEGKDSIIVSLSKKFYEKNKKRLTFLKVKPFWSR
jgi:hypothetical protein